MSRNKKQVPTFDVAALQPDEINALREVVKGYIDRKTTILNEIETLKEDLKTLDEEYTEKLDLKTMKLVEAHFKLQEKIAHKDTFDLFVETLSDPTL